MKMIYSLAVLLALLSTAFGFHPRCYEPVLNQCDADNYCLERGEETNGRVTHLISVASQEQLDSIIDESIFVGRDNDPSFPMWVGLNDCEGTGQYSYADGTCFYSPTLWPAGVPWADGHPIAGNECVYLDRVGGRNGRGVFYSADCKEERNFCCITFGNTGPFVGDDECPDDVITSPGECVCVDEPTPSPTPEPTPVPTPPPMELCELDVMIAIEGSASWNEHPARLEQAKDLAKQVAANALSVEGDAVHVGVARVSNFVQTLVGPDEDAATSYDDIAAAIDSVTASGPQVNLADAVDHFGSIFIPKTTAAGTDGLRTALYLFVDGPSANGEGEDASNADLAASITDLKDIYSSTEVICVVLSYVPRHIEFYAEVCDSLITYDEEDGRRELTTINLPNIGEACAGDDVAPRGSVQHPTDDCNTDVLLSIQVADPITEETLDYAKQIATQSLTLYPGVGVGRGSSVLTTFFARGTQPVDPAASTDADEVENFINDISRAADSYIYGFTADVDKFQGKRHFATIGTFGQNNLNAGSNSRKAVVVFASRKPDDAAAAKAEMATLKAAAAELGNELKVVCVALSTNNDLKSFFNVNNGFCTYVITATKQRHISTARDEIAAEVCNWGSA